MSVDYHKYMASREWALKREAIRTRAMGYCERCHDAPFQSTHHLTYQRLGAEEVDTDLLGVCNPCHKFLSGKAALDPAVQVVLRLIEDTGLELFCMTPRDWSTVLQWTTGPTKSGEHFHGDLKSTDALGPWVWGNYLDDSRLVIPIAEGVWYHCVSY